MRETSLAFGPDGNLVGTVCVPGGAHRANVGMVLFNAGLVHRIGPHRINVRLARSLASTGIPSIRFDLSGQGDSGRRTGAESFDEQVFRDIASAMDALGRESGASRFSLFGFCSGGVHGFAAAQRDARIAGLLLYDTYFYPTVLSRLNRYALSIRDRGLVVAASDWIRRKLAKPPAGESAPVGANGTESFRTPSRAEFAEVVLRLVARGSKVGVIYSGSFNGYNYAGQFHDTFRRWRFGPGSPATTCRPWATRRRSCRTSRP
ncbi:MAG: alpha/beta hydrolase [Betaproteobacteria bacterium]|nr:alpha/beta hydrolase [Betaproteobacteria bacterium]